MTRILDVRELNVLIDKVQSKIMAELTIANRIGILDDVLKKYGLASDIESYPYQNKRNGKILVLGVTPVSKNDLINTSRKLGILDSQIEFIDDYDKITNLNFDRFRYSMVYTDIMIGPIPHKVKDLGDYPSFISRVERNPGEYPKLTRLSGNKGLKISVNSFKDGLTKTELYKSLFS